MICKWCGNSMETRETVCRRCGKEVSPKSDCGGFYDLVPDAAGIVPPMPVQVQSAPKPAKKSGLTVVLALLCCVLLIVVAVVAASGNGVKEEVARLEQKLEAAEEIENIPLNEQDIETVLCLEKNEDDSYSMTVDSDQAGSVVVKCTPSGKKGIVGYIAELTVAGEKNGTAKLQLDQDPDQDALTLQMDLGKAFGTCDEASYSLFYVAEDGSLEELPQKAPEDEEKKNDNDAPKEEPKDDPKNESEDEPKEPEENEQNPLAGLIGDNQEKNQQPEANENEGKTGDSDKQDAEPEQENTDAADVIEYTENGAVILRLPYAYLKEAAAAQELPENTKFVCTLVWKNAQGGSFTVVVEGIIVP